MEEVNVLFAVVLFGSTSSPVGVSREKEQGATWKSKKGSIQKFASFDNERVGGGDVTRVKGIDRVKGGGRAPPTLAPSWAEKIPS